MARAIEQLKQAMEACELGALSLPDQIDALMDAGKSVLQEMSTLTPQNEWVSVEDELPARDGIYLVYTTRGSVTTAHFYAEKIFRDDYKRGASWQGNRNVTHWMFLPASPDRRPPEGEA